MFFLWHTHSPLSPLRSPRLAAPPRAPPRAPGSSPCSCRPWTPTCPGPRPPPQRGRGGSAGGACDGTSSRLHKEGKLCGQASPGSTPSQQCTLHKLPPELWCRNFDPWSATGHTSRCPTVRKRACNVCIFQLSFYFAYHKWWLGGCSRFELLYILLCFYVYL